MKQINTTHTHISESKNQPVTLEIIL